MARRFLTWSLAIVGASGLWMAASDAASGQIGPKTGTVPIAHKTHRHRHVPAMAGQATPPADADQAGNAPPADFKDRYRQIQDENSQRLNISPALRQRMIQANQQEAMQNDMQRQQQSYEEELRAKNNQIRQMQETQTPAPSVPIEIGPGVFIRR